MDRMQSKPQTAFSCAACGAACNTLEELEQHELSCGVEEQQDTENQNEQFDEQDQ